MKYEQKSFSVPASAGNIAYCTEHGHTLPDLKGRCLRCSTRVTVDGYVRQIATDVPPDDKDIAGAFHPGLPCS